VFCFLWILILVRERETIIRLLLQVLRALTTAVKFDCVLLWAVSSETVQHFKAETAKHTWQQKYASTFVLQQSQA
jgi:capsid portal protein